MDEQDYFAQFIHADAIDDIKDVLRPIFDWLPFDVKNSKAFNVEYYKHDYIVFFLAETVDQNDNYINKISQYYDILWASWSYTGDAWVVIQQKESKEASIRRFLIAKTLLVLDANSFE